MISLSLLLLGQTKAKAQNNIITKGTTKLIVGLKYNMNMERCAQHCMLVKMRYRMFLG